MQQSCGLAGFPDYLMWQSYNHFGTPNQINCTNPADTTDHNAILGRLLCHGDRQCPAQQSHPGGVNEAFADGSVHFIKNTISPQTWWALGSRNLGEVISSDSY